MPERSKFAWTLVILGLASCAGKSIGSGDGRLTTLVTSKTGFSSLAVDGADLYWTGADDATSGNANLMTMPVAGGTPRAIASGPGSGPLAVDASNVYWVTSNDVTPGPVLKVRREGGPSVTLATALYHGVTNVAVNSRGLYWPGTTPPDPVSGLQTNGVFTVPLDGGTPELVPGSEGCGEWALVDETNLYCTSKKIPLDGSPPTQLATPAYVSNSTAIFGEAIDASNLYVVTYGCRLWKVPFDGQPAVAIATLPTPGGSDAGIGCGGPLVVDARSAYVSNMGALIKVALDGSGMVTTLATVSQSSEFSFVVDATSVYFIEAGNDGESKIVKLTPK